MERKKPQLAVVTDGAGQIEAPSSGTRAENVRQRDVSLSSQPTSDRSVAGTNSAGSHSFSLLTAISLFSDTVSDTEARFSAKISRLLEIGRMQLGLDVGMLARKRGPDLEVVSAQATPGAELGARVLRRGHRFSLEGTFCATAIRQTIPFTFDYSADVSETLTPECYIGAAVRVNGKTYGTLSFSGYCAEPRVFTEEERLFIKIVARYVGNEIGRIRYSEALTYRIEFEKLLADVSRDFINLGPDEIDQGIRDALHRIAEFAGVDMSYVFIFKDNCRKMDLSHWWMNWKSEPDFRLVDIPVSVYSWSMRKVLNREVVVMPEYHQLPLEAEAERKFIKSQGLKTSILVPLIYAGKAIGLVGFASRDKRILVDHNKVNLLEMVGHTLASAVEHKRAQETLRNLEAQMRHAQKLESLGVLAGGIAHDFNNLLMGVLGNAGVALNELTTKSPARLAIRRIEKIAQHAADLTNQLLAYSGRGKFFVEVLNLSESVEDMVELLETVISKRHSLRTNFATDLPAVEGDPAQLSQVIMNLITNASEAIGDMSGVITLSTGLIAADREFLSDAYLGGEMREGVYAYMRVTDSGCGMNEETLSRIFDPFFTTKFTGRGLGLAAVLGIVRGHKGTVKVSSLKGQGTTFTVLFPCSDKQEEYRSRRVETELPEDEVFTLKQQTGTVLVVDDEDSVRSVVAQLLQQFGFTVLTACDGSTAIEVFESARNDIDAVIVDMTMPDIDGQQVCDAVTKMRSDVRVILTSGYSEQEVAKEFSTDERYRRFIQKPFRPQTLVKSLFEMLKSSDEQTDA